METRPGDVVWIRLRDPQGENEKLRPAIVVDIARNGEVCVVVGATTSFNDSDLSQDLIRLPHSNSKNQGSRTGLKQRTAVLCTWIARVRTEEIEQKAGSVPTVLHTAILERVKAHLESVRD